MTNILILLFFVASICYASLQVKMHNSLRGCNREKQLWKYLSVTNIPNDLKPEAFRREFDTEYEFYEPLLR